MLEMFDNIPVYVMKEELSITDNSKIQYSALEF